MSMETEKGKALDAAVKQIEKDFGKGSIMKLGAASAKMNIETIPTGALSLDIALGVGGIPVAVSLKSMDQSLLVRRRSPFI